MLAEVIAAQFARRSHDLRPLLTWSGRTPGDRRVTQPAQLLSVSDRSERSDCLPLAGDQAAHARAAVLVVPT